MKNRKWEFNSHLEVIFQGKPLIKQVWSRIGEYGEIEWTLTPDTPGKENPPEPGRGHWTNTDAFKKDFPSFNRCVK